MKTSKLIIAVACIAVVFLLAACGKPKSKYEQVEMPTELMDYFAYAKEGSYWIMEDESGNYDSLWVEKYSRLYEYGVHGEEKKYWIYHTNIKSRVKFPTMTAEQNFYQQLTRYQLQDTIRFSMSNNSSSAIALFNQKGEIVSDTSKHRCERLDSITLFDQTYYDVFRVHEQFDYGRYYTFAKGIGCIERSLNPGGAYHFKLKRYHIVH